eukprot:Rmarinus@m.27179
MEESILDDLSSCSTVLAKVFRGMVNPRAPAMSQATLKKYGMAKDPSGVPLVQFIDSMLEICTTTEMVCGLIYSRRLLNAPLSIYKGEWFPALTRYNVHRVIFSGAVLANVQWSDDPYTSRSWARWSCVWSRASVDHMKLMFLKGVDWRLHISDSNFASVVHELETMAKSFQDPL